MILHSYITTLKIQLRDKSAMALMILFPIILTLVIGSSLETKLGQRITEKAIIGIVNLDRGIEIKSREDESILYLSDEFFEQLNNDTVKEIIAYLEYENMDKCLLDLDNNKLDAIYVIPNEYSSMLKDKEETSIDIYIGNRSRDGAFIARQFLSTFCNRSNINSIADDDREIELINKVYSKSYIEEIGFSNDYFPRAIDYYGVTMLIMVCLYGGMYSVRIISRIFLHDMGNKLVSTRKGLFDVYIGTSFASITTVFLQIVFLFLFFKYIYKVNYGNDYLSLFAVIFVFIVFSILLGQFLVLLCNSEGAASGIINILIIALSFITDSYVILDQGNGLFEHIVNNFLPNAVAINYLFSEIYITESVSMITAIFTITIYIILLLSFSILLLKKRRGH